MRSVKHTVLINEQRQYPRYQVQIPASIRLKNGIHYLGTTNNISNNGAFVEYNGGVEIGEETHAILTLYVEGEVYSEEIKIKCMLKPARNNGIGLEFKSMSPNDFINFIYLLSSKAPNPEKYFTELKSNPGVKLVEAI